MRVSARLLRLPRWRTTMKSIFTTFPLAAIAASFAGAQTVRYTVTDLGTFGGNFSIAYGVDNSGRVAGSAANPSGDTHAFLSGIAKTDLGTFTGGHNSQAGGPGPGSSSRSFPIPEHPTRTTKISAGSATISPAGPASGTAHCRCCPTCRAATMPRPWAEQPRADCRRVGKRHS